MPYTKAGFYTLQPIHAIGDIINLENLNRKTVIINSEKIKITELKNKHIVYCARSIFSHEKYTIGKQDWFNGRHISLYGKNSLNDFIFFYTLKLIP